MKHKIGDKVRVKSLDWYNANKNQCGHITGLDETFVDEMSKFCGKLVTINSVTKYCYHINEDEYKYNWTDAMFEGNMENEVKIKIPEGYCIDEENSTFECIKFKKKPEIQIYKYDDTVKVKTSEHIFHILDKEDLKTNFDSAFKLAKLYDCEATIPTIEQWNIIYAYLDKINSLLKNKIEKDYYWTSEEYSSSESWIVTMNYGCSITRNCNTATRVRPIKNYK